MPAKPVMKTPSIRSARIFFTILVGLSALGAYATLLYVGRGGAISEKSMHEGMRYLADYYAPLGGIIVGSYFADRVPNAKVRPDRALPEAYAFGAIVLAIWAALPILSLAINATYESSIRTLDNLKLFGSGPAAAAVAFFFAKTRR